VRVIEIDSQGRINLSAIHLDEPWEPSMVRPREERGPARPGIGGRGPDRGGRSSFGGRPERRYEGTAEVKEEEEIPKARFRPRR